MPEATYWVEFQGLFMKDVVVDPTTTVIPIDFPSVDTTVSVVVNGVEVENPRMRVRPTGAPGDMSFSKGGDGPHPWTPGLYDVWLTSYANTDDVMPLFGIPYAPAGLLVDNSGTASISFTLPSVSGTVTCSGRLASDTIGFRPDGIEWDLS